MPAEFAASMKQLANELAMLRQAASFGTFSFGVLVGLVLALVLYHLFRSPPK